MTGDLDKQKTDLRGRIRAALHAVRPEDAAGWSRSLCRNLTASTPWRSARTIMGYAPLAGEADVAEACREAISAGKTLALPRIDWDSSMMTAARVTSIDAGLVVRRHGVREPGPDAPATDPATLDLVLVPGVAFDAGGRRLGRGGGYYDRFLRGLAARSGGSGTPLSVATIGVAFEVQFVAHVPTGPHDVPVQLIVTERRVIAALNTP
ncbi:MAG: 5-formyltetrahydrofolate cyclo-ligase [Phycisphaerales bacterium]